MFIFPRLPEHAAIQTPVQTQNVKIVFPAAIAKVEIDRIVRYPNRKFSNVKNDGEHFSGELSIILMWK